MTRSSPDEFGHVLDPALRHRSDLWIVGVIFAGLCALVTLAAAVAFASSDASGRAAFWRGFRAAFGITAASAETVRSSAGGVASGLTHEMAARATCLIHNLEKVGARINLMGGGPPRRNDCNPPYHLHGCGRAIDVCQTRRNVYYAHPGCHMPSRLAQNAIAASCGLISGGQWEGDPDTGHFQLGGWPGRRQYLAQRRENHEAGHHHGRTYARIHIRGRRIEASAWHGWGAQ